jgi:hypothetical protein
MENNMLNYYVTEECDFKAGTVRVLASLTIDYEASDEKVRARIIKETKRAASALNDRLTKVLSTPEG